MKKLVSLLCLVALLCISLSALAAGKLEEISARGELLVGTTGDYRPMSYRDKETGTYEGFDTEVSTKMAEALGVKVRFVPTTWKTLTADTMAGKFDMAMCGITRTYARAKDMDMSRGYLVFGKTILCRKADAGKFKSLADINKAGVRVMYNPGGTNEKFALESCKNAQLIMYPQNAEIPDQIAAGKADVMITETMEARKYARTNEKLAAPLVDNPFTKNCFGILMPKGNQDFLNFVNFFMEENEFNGTLARLEEQYIK